MSERERALVEMRSLEKRYADRVVLHLDRLELCPGRSYALIGPNGAGKSTFLRIVAGRLAPTAGTVISRAASVGYMPQKGYVFGFSVRKNVSLAVEAAGFAGSERDRRVEAALEVVGMREFARAKGSELSGGEAQRVALARMVAVPHDLLLLDEPTASMDVRGTRLAEQALADYAADAHCAVVVSTHAPSQALRIAQEGIMLCDGAVVESGPIEDVVRAPKSDQGREFLAYWAMERV